VSDERIDNLEMKIAYQEDTIQALNDIVVQQQAKLVQLEKSCDFLAEQLKGLMESGEAGQSQDERPPHY